VVPFARRSVGSAVRHSDPLDRGMAPASRRSHLGATAPQSSYDAPTVPATPG
jgi:hypothetical protein